MRLKQICNHPSQWLNDGGWAETDSGKLARLREVAEVVASRQEKMLVFTQFREAAVPLAAFLGDIFGRSGLVLHGEIPVKQRGDLVQRFQEDESVPFFVLSLKAGGAGLTLTAASHVAHFDRWWNPAVENQASDRAFRIGQKKNVLVHKFICRGTVEEKNRCHDRVEARSVRCVAGRRRRDQPDRDDRRGCAAIGCSRPECCDEGLRAMSRYDGGWVPYIPVAERRRRSEIALAKLRKGGPPVAPVTIVGRVIATTFWGRAWCDNMESYRDYESRLPRGRSYVRNGSVIDLQIAPGQITGLVSGSDLYRVAITIKETAKAQWRAICADCAGSIDSLVELLQGRLSKGIMERILSAGERIVSAAIRYPLLLQLPGPCVDVQARGCSVVWCWCAA